jgi:AAA family ATP:ADP antiporter
VTTAGDRLAAVLARAVDVRADEIRALLLSFAYFFCLLCGYYIIRPLREEMGIAGGVENLPWLFTGTFVAMLVAVPLFGATVARFAKRRIVPLVYRFFIANILIFFVLLRFDIGAEHVARAFFIWTSVYNLFVVSVFWSFMADVFRNDQARRLFGFIAAGGSAGALLGPALTAALAVPLGPVALLLISALFLEGAVQCVRRLTVAIPARARDDTSDGAPIGGGVFAGITLVLRSRYLLGICLYILIFTTTSTFLYFQQAHIVAAAFDDPAERTRLFALIDLSVGVLTLLVQCFATGRLIGWLGVGPVLAALPLLTVVGFVGLAMAPTLVVLVAFQSIRRAANFAIAKPSREVLYTVLDAERKYKAKNVIDTLVYRGGDAVSGWAYAGLSAIGLGLPAIALAAVPLAGVWMATGLRLGRAQDRMAARTET